MLRTLIALAALVVAAPASAGNICVVDFQQALQKTKKGQETQSRLQQAYATRMSELEKQKKDLQTAFEDYEQRKLILNDEARQEAEQNLMSRQQKLQSDMLRYEQELSKQQREALNVLAEEMKTTTTAIAGTKDCDVVLDRQAVVYNSPVVIDLTSLLIQKYNGG